MERAPVRAPLIKNLEFKVGLLLILTLALATVFLIYTLYARGFFARTQQLTLVSDNADGVSVGMTMSFSGFPIGQVQSMYLSQDGSVRIVMAIPVKDAKWLRTSSVFMLEKSLVGSAKLRAYSAELKDPPLPDHAERPLYLQDPTSEFPTLVFKARNILTNLETITGPDSSLSHSLADVRVMTSRMTGKHGVLGGVLGDDAQQAAQAIEHANATLANLTKATAKLDTILNKTDQRVYGQGGIMDETQKAMVQINAILGDARESLKKVDAILKNTQSATTNLDVLRAQVDDSLNRVNGMINELNRKWPFSHKPEVKLP